MANSTIGRLLVEIGLDSSKFNPELKKISNNIKSLEKDLKNMDKEFGNVGKSITGLEKKQELLNKALSESSKAIDLHIKQRDAYAKQLKKEKEELDKLRSTKAKDKEEEEKIAKQIMQKEKAMQSVINKMNKEQNAIDKITSKQQVWLNEVKNTNNQMNELVNNSKQRLSEVEDKYDKLINKTESYDETLERISSTNSTVNSELKAQQNILEASGKKFQAYHKQAEIVENSLRSSIEAYKEHRKEIEESDKRIASYNESIEEQAELIKQAYKNQELYKEIYGETSDEYIKATNLVTELNQARNESIRLQQEEISHNKEVIQSLAQSKEEVTEYYKSLKEVGSTKLTRGLKLTSESLISVSEATRGASAVGVAVGSGTSAIFMEYEDGLAKISTLVSGSKQEIEQVGKDIINISNQTGQGLKGLMESAYDALSSGVKVGELNSFLETSSKMATAGFTDNESAVRLLTQTMNTYGDKVGDVSVIADKFAKIQDIGVITIDEMSRVMSESLSLGVSYGVQFDDIGASIVKMTLAGEDASGASTNLARLLEELAKDGSKVSDILKEKTGKSFSQLSKEGMHLNEILRYIADYAKETGVEFTSLWGSSNAGVGMLQILSEEGMSYNEALQELGNSSGLLQQNFDKLSDTSAFKLQSALNELKNSFIEIGQALTPFIDGVSSAISGLAKVIDGLPDGVKSTIGIFSGLMAVLSPLSMLSGKASGGLFELIENYMALTELNEKGGNWATKGAEGLLSKFFGKPNEIKNEGAKVTKEVMEALMHGMYSFNFDKDLSSTFAENIGIFLVESIGDQAEEASIQMKRKLIEEFGTDFGMEVGAALGNGVKKATKEGMGEVANQAMKAADAVDDLADSANNSIGIFGSLWNIMKAHPYVAITAGALGLVAVVKKLYDTYKENHKAQDTKHQEALAQAKEETKAREATLQSQEQELKTINGLADRYNELNSKQKLTKEEEEERLGILKQIAEIDPLLVEYDANGNPIALMNDALLEYIENLERAIREQEILVQQGYRDQQKESEGALGEKTKEYQEKGKDRENRINEIKNGGTKFERDTGSGTDRGDKVEVTIPGMFTVEWTEDKEQMRKDIDEYLDLIEQENQDIADYAKERQEISDINRDYINSEVESLELLKDVSEEGAASYERAMSSFDFSEFNTSELNAITFALTDFFATCSEEEKISFDNSISAINEAEANFRKGAITLEEYSAVVDKYVPIIAELLGVSEEVAKKMIGCPQFDSESALKTSNDIDTARANLMQKLLTMGDLDADMRVKFATEILLDENVPEQVRDEIAKAMADGKITDEEWEIILKAACEVDDSEFVETEEKMYKMCEQKNLDVNVAIGLAKSGVEDFTDLVEFIDGADLDAKGKVELVTAFNEKDFDKITETISTLPEEQQVGIFVAMHQSGKFTPEELKDFYEDLPPEVQSMIKISAENGALPQELAEQLGLIPEETESNVKFTSDNSEVEKTKQENSQPTSSEHTTNSNNSGVEADKSKNKQPTSSEHKTNSNNSDVEADKSKNKQSTDSDHIFKGDNSDVRAKMRENQEDTSSTHTIFISQVFKTAGKIAKGLVGSVIQRAVKDPVIVDPVTLQATTKPIVVDDFTATVNSASASIQASANTFNNAQNNAIATIQARNFTDTINSSSSWLNNSINYDVDLLQDFNAQLDRLTNKLETVSQKAELAFGSSKANLLKNEISLLQQKQQMLEHEKNEYIAMNNNLKSMLSQQGFRVDGNGAVTNYASRLLELEKAVERAKKAQDAYEGDDKNRQKSLQNAYDSANDRLQKAKETLDKYYDTSSKIGDTEKEWYDVQQAIRDTKNEIYEANREARNFYTDAHIKELEYAYDELGSKIDLINSKMEHEGNYNKISLLQQELNLLQQQQQKNNELLNSYKQQQQYFKEFLGNKGFGFDYLGDIINAEQKLSEYRTSDEYEAILDAYEQYMEIQSSTLPDLAKEWQDLQNSQIEVKEEIEGIKDELDELAKTKALDFLDELIQKQEVLSNKLAELDGKLELVSFGTRGDILREQVGIIEEQIKLLERTNVELERQQMLLRQDMLSDGFRFDNNGDIANLDHILALAKTKEEYDKLKEKAEEYYETQNSIAEGKAEWYEYKKELQDTQDEIANLKYELKDLLYESDVRDATNEITVLQNELDKLDAMQDLNGKNSIEIYKQQEALINKQKDATQDLLDVQMKRKDELANELISYGFSINDDGTIDNTANKLADLKELLSENEFSRVENFLVEYFNVALEEIPELEKQLIDYQAAFEEIEEEKLNAAKQIEDEITKIYEKQIDERIEKIEEERDAQVESLNKAKDAYSKWRAEVDYEDTYDEQLQKVQDLQAQIEMAQRDDSLSGKKRLEDLMEQLNEEQKNLEDIVQDRTDTLINDMFDSQIEHIEDRAEDEIKDLEDTFSETKIADIVAEAMKTGIFEDIDGNITSLDSALMDFANNSTDYLGVMGDTMKTELLDNLAIALDYMKQMQEVSLNLGDIEYNTQRFAGIGYQKGVIEGVVKNTTNNNDNSKVINVEFNPQITVGSGANVSEEDILKVMDRAKSDFMAEMEHKILSNMK